jgi:hypothetical protein
MFDRLSQMAHAVKRDRPGRGATSSPAAAVAVAGAAAVADAAAVAGAAAVADAVTHADADADERTVDQLRADLLADLVLTGAPSGHDTADGLLGAISARVEVTVPVLTLMSAPRRATAIDPAPSATDPATAIDPATPIDPAPSAELDGVVPIDAATARRLAGAASGWDRVLTHPITGALLAVDRYRPSEDLRRHLRARDQRCRFPGCALASRKCDLDHNHDAALGGETAHTNLATFCRRHHMLKHHSPWHVTHRPGGVLEWTAPTGRVYIDRPPPQNTVVFVPAAHPAF